MGDTPSQVRVRTGDDYAHRYDSIQAAKTVFDVGNNTDAIVNACEHARQDERAKQDALQYLAGQVPPDVLQETIQRLGTTALPISVETAVGSDRDGVAVDVTVGSPD
jgi:hypothetical protein